MFEEVESEEVTWRFDMSFLLSNWTCIWGRGCLGILDVPAEELGQGCCSIGAELVDDDEARNVAALGATLPADRFEYYATARAGGVFGDAQRLHTRIVDGACIFLNRRDFPGGAGCALHLGALDAGESPIDWKPAVCWQLPIRVDWEPDPEHADRELATVRGWSRADWGPEGETMAWCCTEGDRAYVGDRPVVESLAAELEEVVGTEVFVDLRRRVGRASPTPGSRPAPAP